MKAFSSLVLVALVAACGGPRGAAVDSPEPSAPVPTSGAAVEQFMQAVADSNLTRMGQLWGTTSGPASATGQPVRWREHVVVMQAWLKGGTFRVIGNMDTAGGEGRRQVTIELDRGGCTKQIPFTVARLGSGSWLVVNVDISQAGNPARPCGDS